MVGPSGEVVRARLLGAAISPQEQLERLLRELAMAGTRLQLGVSREPLSAASGCALVGLLADHPGKWAVADDMLWIMAPQVGQTVLAEAWRIGWPVPLSRVHAGPGPRFKVLDLLELYAKQA